MYFSHIFIALFVDLTVIFAYHSTSSSFQFNMKSSRFMATDAFSGLRTKFSSQRGKDSRLDELDAEARKNVVLSLTDTEKFLADALKDSKAEDAPRIRTMVKATVLI